ncbi:hypothetical protein [Bradyrhizobium sp. C9]|uniref:hypothetical protein n=1 Tax=Bradyrhizobium sp. C9 TaxID=142585 RepID=UPI000BEA5D7D|nr:hypothetical protein [Bradyrhizobium sp. C9]PDT77146.1 hypothetical protein CO675_11365 [Bradyrhizobium sp. C9]
MTISRRGFLGAALGLFGGAAAARPTPATSGFTFTADEFVIAPPVPQAIFAAGEVGGFVVPEPIAETLRGWMTRDEVLSQEYAIDMNSVHGGCTRDMPEELKASAPFRGVEQAR